MMNANSHFGTLRYSKNPNIRTLNFEGQAAVGSYLNIRLLGS